MGREDGCFSFSIRLSMNDLTGHEHEKRWRWGRCFDGGLGAKRVTGVATPVAEGLIRCEGTFPEGHCRLYDERRNLLRSVMLRRGGNDSDTARQLYPSL